MTDPSEQLTTGELAAMVGVSPRTVDRWSDGGLLVSGWRVGRGWRRFHRAEAEAIVAGEHDAYVATFRGEQT